MTEPRTPNVADFDADTAVVTSRVASDALVTQAWERNYAEIYNFLRRATRDEEAAQDLLQETFLRLTTVVGQGRPPENVRAWLYRVAANLATSRGRRRSTVSRWLRLHGEREAQPGIEESPESGMLRREDRANLEAALASLSPDARTALLLARDGFSGIEIAEAIGRSHAATRTLLCRARVDVRLELERREAVG